MSIDLERPRNLKHSETLLLECQSKEKETKQNTKSYLEFKIVHICTVKNGVLQYTFVMVFWDTFIYIGVT